MFHAGVCLEFGIGTKIDLGRENGDDDAIPFHDIKGYKGSHDDIKIGTEGYAILLRDER